MCNTKDTQRQRRFDEDTVDSLVDPYTSLWKDLCQASLSLDQPDCYQRRDGHICDDAQGCTGGLSGNIIIDLALRGCYPDACAFNVLCSTYNCGGSGLCTLTDHCEKCEGREDYQPP